MSFFGDVHSTKNEVFGVIWTDKMVGPLSLTKATAAEAIKTAFLMREKGKDKILDCFAVHVAAGSDRLEYIG